MALLEVWESARSTSQRPIMEQFLLTPLLLSSELKFLFCFSFHKTASTVVDLRCSDVTFSLRTA